MGRRDQERGGKGHMDEGMLGWVKGNGCMGADEWQSRRLALWGLSFPVAPPAQAMLLLCPGLAQALSIMMCKGWALSGHHRVSPPSSLKEALVQAAPRAAAELGASSPRAAGPGPDRRQYLPCRCPSLPVLSTTGSASSAFPLARFLLPHRGWHHL